MTQNAEIPAPRGYWQHVWAEFRSRRIAVVGGCCAALLVLTALLVPFLAQKAPMVWHQNGVTTFPLLRDFFAIPDETPEKLLEKTFNWAALCAITCGPLWLVLRRRTATRTRRTVLGLFALLLVVPFALTKPFNDAVPYRQLAAEGKGFGIFPLIPYGPFENTFGINVPPSWTNPERDPANGYHLFGTDMVGRDVLVRMIHGTRVALAVGVISVALSTLLGIFIGSIAGYFGGWVDMLISRFIEVMMCFPTFFLILTVIAIMPERSIINIILVIGLTSWTDIARLMRGEVLRQRNLDYVAAARALGGRNVRIIFHHILPNALAPVLVSLSFMVAGSILAESGLSFLGFGVDLPTASWGELLNEAREAPELRWWTAVFPGAAIFLTVTICNLVGEALRDAMDPRLRGGRS